MVVYTNTHRLFLQAVISRRVFTIEQGNALYLSVKQVTGDESDVELGQFIGILNQAIFDFDYEIREGVEETTGDVVWAFVNTTSDAAAELATELTALEIAYFRRILECIVLADDEHYSIGSMDAINESSKLKNTTVRADGEEAKSTSMTKLQAEKLLDHFVERGWLAMNGVRYSLGARSLLELQTYLKEQYEEDIKECTLCMNIVTKGQRCELISCPARLHHHCAKRYFSNQSANQCPTCATAWKSDNIVGDVDQDGKPLFP